MGAVRPIAFAFILIVTVFALPALANVPYSEATQECIDCHSSYTPGIVGDWQRSRHAQVTPDSSLALPELQRRISSETIPEGLRGIAVGCYECHSQNAAAHTDNFEHFGYQINIVVSPEDCRVCHSAEVEQFAGSKKAHAIANLHDNPLYHDLVNKITGVKELDGEQLVFHPGSASTGNESCFGCHGTDVQVIGTRTIETDLGEIEVPVLSNWPNQGVGRANPDGSFGACTACHPRHSFSIEIARKPQTCSQCHLAPDAPAWDVYRESKHGNIVLSQLDQYDWTTVPWKPGIDFFAPTCATCHNALLTTVDNEIIVERTHDFGARLWVRIFGLIYSHPQPDSGATYLIRNADGLPLPTTFAGDLASDYLIDSDEQAVRKGRMTAVCRACHGTSWIDGHFAKFDSTLVETDRMVRAATELMQQAWDKKLADPRNPFDESLEFLWIRQWLFYANSTRYAGAMSGPDYAGFKNGWWSMSENLLKMHHAIHPTSKED